MVILGVVQWENDSLFMSSTVYEISIIGPPVLSVPLISRKEGYFTDVLLPYRKKFEVKTHFEGIN